MRICLQIMQIRLGLVFTAGFDQTFEAYDKREQAYLFSLMVFLKCWKIYKGAGKLGYMFATCDVARWIRAAVFIMEARAV